MRCQVYIPKELEEVLLNDAKKQVLMYQKLLLEY